MAGGIKIKTPEHAIGSIIRRLVYKQFLFLFVVVLVIFIIEVFICIKVF